jgi:serine/threonine protein kinase
MLSDGAIIFKVKDLSIATENFSSARKVGTSVFRGSVHGMDVAVVVVKNGVKVTDFITEVKNLCSVHHTNLVKLIGGCNSGSQVYLVYEFVTSGNLRQYLHSQYSPGFSALSTWTGRLQVILDVAKGLEYLHHHTHTPFVHKYLKSSNILLDSELHAKIAYFGVAKVKGEMGTLPVGKVHVAEEANSSTSSSGELRDGEAASRRLRRSLTRSHSIKISGTHGYMAPEEKSSGLITPKLDVFAFGVILLEIMSGKEAVSFQTNPHSNTFKKTLLPDVIMAIFADKEPGRRLRAWMDPLLGDSAPLDSALKTAELAKDCVNPEPELRPEMSKVALTLSKILMNSQAREKSLLAARGALTSTIEPR